MKTDFEKMCDDFEKDYKMNENEVTYIRKYLLKYADGNRDKILKIKAEAQEADYFSYLSIKTATLALVISTIGVIYNLTPYQSDMANIIVNIVYLVLIIYASIKIGLNNKFKVVGKWRNYVIVAVEDILSEVQFKQHK